LTVVNARTLLSCYVLYEKTVGGSPFMRASGRITKEVRLARTQRRKAADYGTHRTRDHETIRRWAEERGGHPAFVEDTQILRIDFDDPDGSRDEHLRRVPWEEFFRIFDDRDLEFLYQEHTHDGKISRFNKFVYAGGDREQE
jgi:hypothetical protein